MKKTLIKAAACAAACIIPVAALCGCETAVDTSSLDWVASIIENYYYKDVSTDNIYKYTASEFVAEYLDQYSAYYTAEEYAEVVNSNNGSKSGFGITYSYIKSKGVLVSAVIFNSPAYMCGLRPGDFILSAVKDGIKTAFDSQSEFKDYVAELTTGDEVTFVTSDGGEYTMAKSDYTASYVTFATNESSWAFLSDDSGALTLTESTTDAIEDLPDGAGYICLSQFYGDAASEFAQAVETLNSCNCTSIIIDLRSNGGGYVQTMQYISACFVDSGEVAMTATYKSGSTSSYAVDSRYITSDECKVKEGTDVYVLANSNTASASEALIGVLVSYGVIDYTDIYVSEYDDDYVTQYVEQYETDDLKSGRTYGKGIMQTTYTRNSTGEALKLTVAQIYWPDGTTIHDVGITTADGAHAVSSPYPASGEGEELSSAIKLIYNL